jgi:glutamyl/glutaminyl-tRNA synthetase
VPEPVPPTPSTMIRTRFAPSPTGHLHVGGARTALFCWAFSRGLGGRFLLRIEDTDQKRSSIESGIGFCQDLEWLGIDWDEGPEHNGHGGGDAGPYFQSERLELYTEHILRLLGNGKAYCAFETPEELAASRKAAREAKIPYKYDRAALDLDQETIDAWIAEGRPHVVRFKVPDGPVNISDKVLGDVVVPSGELEDFIIQKADGFPTYHFAVVVDDALMEVSHVIRGQEHLNNTAKHMVLQDALGFDRPIYAHLSLIFNPDGSKMSKRDKDKAIRAAVVEQGVESSPVLSDGTELIPEDEWERWKGSKDVQLSQAQVALLAEHLGIDMPEIDVEDFKRAGYLPGVLINYLSLLGWSPGNDIEQFDAAFLVESFSLDRVLKSPAKFDRAKLRAFNQDAIQAMSGEEFLQELTEYCRREAPEFIDAMTPEQFRMFAESNHPRCRTLLEPVRSGGFFLQDDAEVQWEMTKPVRKALLGGEICGFDHLTSVLPLLQGLPEWSREQLESVVDRYAAEHADGKVGKVAQPLRVAVSGGTVSPPIYDTLAILGRDSVLCRIQRCLGARQSLSSTS